MGVGRLLGSFISVYLTSLIPILQITAAHAASSTLQGRAGHFMKNRNLKYLCKYTKYRDPLQ